MKILSKLQLVGALSLGLASTAFAGGISGSDSYGSVGYSSTAELVANSSQSCAYENTDATFGSLLEYKKDVDQVKKQQSARLHVKPVPMNQTTDSLTHGYGSVGYTGLARNWGDIPNHYVDNLTFGYESAGYNAEQFKTANPSC